MAEWRFMHWPDDLALKEHDPANKVVTPCALVVMVMVPARPLLHRPTGWGDQALILALLIDRRRAWRVGRIDVEADDLVQFWPQTADRLDILNCTPGAVGGHEHAYFSAPS